MATASDTVTLPTVFKNNLISVNLYLANDTLSIYTDTGGKNFLYKSGMKKLDVKRSKKNIWLKSNIENILTKQNFPIPDIKDIYFTNDKHTSYDGMFGREWFANKVWEFNYENKTLKYIKNLDKKLSKNNQTVRLYFKSDSNFTHTHHLPRIEIVVKSDTLSMLLDSGAQTFLSTEAQKQLSKNKLVASSFINSSTFDKWKNTYTNWTILSDADISFGKKSDIIIVPEVKIGNTSVGPIEFAKREDSNFEVMSDLFMDEEIVGALGGNALSKLKTFIVNYEAEELVITQSD